jgi:hypothetical protein
MQLMKYCFTTKLITLEQILKLFSNWQFHDGTILQVIMELVMVMVILYANYNLCKLEWCSLITL